MKYIIKYNKLSQNELTDAISGVFAKIFNQIGDENTPYFKDYTTKKRFKNSKYGAGRRKCGIVEVNSEEQTLTIGFFTFVPWVSTRINLPGEQNLDIDLIGLHILDQRYLYKNVNQGTYYYTYNVPATDEELAIIYSKGSGKWPYLLSREYNVENLNVMGIWSASHDNMDTSKIPPMFNTEHLKYTFGLEFETTRGFIPLYDCVNSGLVPLRDGSISGVEYATIVLEKEKGLFLLSKQLELLKQCTDFDHNCSLHMHLGGMEIGKTSIWNLYLFAKQIQSLFISTLGANVFSTAYYKDSQKEYCQKLPNIGSFLDFYCWLSGGNSSFLGSFTEPHPQNDNKRHKWNIGARYYWLNFINLCFYNTCKTAEFRFLKPTYNYNKIVNWLFVFNAILLIAEKYKTVTELNRFQNNIDNLNSVNSKFFYIFREVYPDILADYLSDFMRKCHTLHSLQYQTNDEKGIYIEPEQYLFTNNITNIDTRNKLNKNFSDDLINSKYPDLKLLMDSNKFSCYPEEGIKEGDRIVFVDREGIKKNEIDNEILIHLGNAIDPADLDF